MERDNANVFIVRCAGDDDGAANIAKGYRFQKTLLWTQDA
jgi:hypothetical protein